MTRVHKYSKTETNHFFTNVRLGVGVWSNASILILFIDASTVANSTLEKSHRSLKERFGEHRCYDRTEKLNKATEEHLKPGGTEHQ